MSRKQFQLKENNANSLFWASFAFIKKTWESTLDWVYPPQCAHCGRVDTLLCEQCISAIIPRQSGYQSPLASCPHIVLGPHQGVLQSAIHALKYDNARRLGQILGAWLAEIIIEENMTFDWVIPVPLHTTRLYERGYNQAKLIATQIADESSAELKDNVLLRQRHTTSQVKLSAEERRHNVDGAFTISAQQPAPLKGVSILLVDDVCTTGSTLKACIEALNAIGDVEIAVATVSYAIH